MPIRKKQDVATEKVVKKTPNAKRVELVEMVKGDKTAEVHPDEVVNFKKGGWNEAQTMSLNATAGSSSAEAYCTVAEADTYNVMHPATADWTGTDTEKENCIKVATRWLDERVSWNGTKETTTQALRIPRSSWVNLDNESIDATTIPTAIKNATAELARHIKKDGDLGANADGKGITDLKVGSVALTFDKTDTADVLPSIVQEMLRGWGTIHGRAKFGIVEVVRS